MANSLSAFNPSIWSTALQESFTKQSVALNFVNNAYDGNISRLGDTVYINTLGDVNVFVYDPTSDLPIQDLTATKEALQINQAYAFNFRVDDIEKVQANTDLVAQFGAKGARKLTQTLDHAILSQVGASGNIIAGASGVALTPTSSTVDGLLLDASKRLDKNDVPRDERWMVVSPDFAKSLEQADIYIKGSQVGDTLIQTARFPGGASQNPQYLGKARGFDIWLSNNLFGTASGENANVTRIPYGQGKPVFFAAQIPEEGEGMIEALRSEHRIATMCRGLILYGLKVTTEGGKALGYIKVDESAA